MLGAITDYLLRVLQLCRKELLAILKDPASRVILVAPAIMQSLIFGYAATYDLQRVDYALLDQSHSAAARELVARLEGGGVFRRAMTLRGLLAALALTVAYGAAVQAAILWLVIGHGWDRWLWLDLVGRKSNRDAIGASVTLTTASGRKLRNHVAPSGGFMSSSDRRLHFGLGKESEVRSLEIRWPSGRTQTLERVTPDRVLKIEEPS